MPRPEPVGPGLAPDPADVPVFILCGGQGTRLGDGAAGLPKPMLDIGDRPMLLHVMGCYGRHGYRRLLARGEAAWLGEQVGAYDARLRAAGAAETADPAREAVDAAA